MDEIDRSSLPNDMNQALVAVLEPGETLLFATGAIGERSLPVGQALQSRTGVLSAGRTVC
jgi:hypothetical protein